MAGLRNSRFKRREPSLEAIGHIPKAARWLWLAKKVPDGRPGVGDSVEIGATAAEHLEHSKLSALSDPDR